MSFCTSCYRSCLGKAVRFCSTAVVDMLKHPSLVTPSSHKAHSCIAWSGQATSVKLHVPETCCTVICITLGAWVAPCFDLQRSHIEVATSGSHLAREGSEASGKRAGRRPGEERSTNCCRLYGHSQQVPPSFAWLQCVLSSAVLCLNPCMRPLLCFVTDVFHGAAVH